MLESTAKCELNHILGPISDPGERAAGIIRDEKVLRLARGAIEESYGFNALWESPDKRGGRLPASEPRMDSKTRA